MARRYPAYLLALGLADWQLSYLRSTRARGPLPVHVLAAALRGFHDDLHVKALLRYMRPAWKTDPGSTAQFRAAFREFQARASINAASAAYIAEERRDREARANLKPFPAVRSVFVGLTPALGSGEVY